LLDTGKGIILGKERIKRKVKGEMGRSSNSRKIRFGERLEG
jgi:hypothetical protein